MYYYNLVRTLTNDGASSRFLGHLYAAEALIKLSRLPEAIMHLSTENVSNISIVPPCGAADSGKVENPFSSFSPPFYAQI